MPAVERVDGGRVKRCAFRRRVVIMVKVPVAGRVKTRLAREIGVVPATSFYRHVTSAVASRVQSSQWETILAVAPDAGIGSRLLPKLKRIAQRAGDLGSRMQRVMDQLPPGPAIIIGSDIPGITARHISQAFRLLGARDAVLGPAPDGGYWLVGFRRTPRVPRGFRNVRWSGPYALFDTKQSLAGCSIGETNQLQDVDDAKDLARLGSNAGRRIVAGD